MSQAAPWLPWRNASVMSAMRMSRTSGRLTILASAGDMARAMASTVRAGFLVMLRCMDRIRARARAGHREPHWKPIRFCQRMPRVMPGT